MARVSAFGQWLKKWRKARGLTQVQLAQRAGCGQSIISQYERGVKTDVGDDFTRPEPDTIERLADALSRPIEEARALAGYLPSPAPMTLREVQDYTPLPMIDFETGIDVNLTTGETHMLTPEEIAELIQKMEMEMDVLKQSILHYTQKVKTN